MPLVFQPIDRVSSLLRVLTNAMRVHEQNTAFVRAFPLQRRSMIEGWCDTSELTIPDPFNHNAPILMMAVGIADYRVQDNVLCDALSCIVAVHSYEPDIEVNDLQYRETKPNDKRRHLILGQGLSREPDTAMKITRAGRAR